MTRGPTCSRYPRVNFYGAIKTRGRTPKARRQEIHSNKCREMCKRSGAAELWFRKPRLDHVASASAAVIGALDSARFVARRSGECAALWGQLRPAPLTARGSTQEYLSHLPPKGHCLTWRVARLRRRGRQPTLRPSCKAGSASQEKEQEGAEEKSKHWHM